MSEKIQITITEKNYHEQEVFSYIVVVHPKRANRIVKFCEDLDDRFPATYAVELNTTFTKDQVIILNTQSNNTYMNRYGFYLVPDKLDYKNESLFYKSGVLV